ncbi:zinc finger, CCHC-type containing protein [Tanacetum coccineum]
MHFLLSSMSVVYVLTTYILEDGGDDATMKQIKKRNKLDNDDYVCRGLILKAFMSTSKLNDSTLWHARLGHVHFKRMQDMSKNGLISAFDMDTEKCKTCMLNKITKKPFQNVKRETKVLELIYSDLCDLHATPSLKNKKYFVTFIDDASRFCYVYLLQLKDEALDKFKVFKTKVELQQGSQIKRFRTDRRGEYIDTLYFQSIGIIHETTAPYTPQQNGISKRKNRVLKEMVNSMLSYSGLSQGFWGEALVVVRLPDPKLKTLRERGIECIFVGYAEHSKAFSFSSVPRPSLRIPNGTKDISGSVVPKEVIEEVIQQLEPELRKSKRNKTPKDFGLEFQLYLIEGTMDEVSDQHFYCFNVEDDPKIFDEAMKSQDVAFWKEAINDEMDFIMGNNTWVLADLPPGCKPLGCKWIFKRKLVVDETIEKFKARLVIQGFKQKSGINYFDTYASVARISTIRLLIAMASIHNLIIHQMDVKTAFLNGDLNKEFYMNQPQGFIIHGNENKVCNLIKSLYGLKQAPKQWHQKFDEVVLSNGYLLNQDDKCVYSKFDESGKGVIICLYVDDMLIFGTDQVQVDMTKEFLSSKFSMKDMGEADGILVIRIKHGSNGIAIYQSHYIEKVLKKFNYFDCTLVSTSMDTSEKPMPNNGQAVSQLEYSRVFGCLMYAMTCTSPDIAFAVGKLSMYTINPANLNQAADIDAKTERSVKDNMAFMSILDSCPGFCSGGMVLKDFPRALSWRRKAEFNKFEYFGDLFHKAPIELASTKAEIQSNCTHLAMIISFAHAGKKKSSEEFHTGVCGREKGRDAALIDRVCDLEGICETLLTLPKEVKSLRGRFFKLESIIHASLYLTRGFGKEETLKKHYKYTYSSNQEDQIIRLADQRQRQQDDISNMAEVAEQKIQSKIQRLYNHRETMLNKIAEEDKQKQCIGHMNSPARMKLAIEICMPKKRKYVDVMRSLYSGLSIILNVTRIKQLANQKNVLNPFMNKKSKSVKPWIGEFSVCEKHIFDLLVVTHV